MVRTTCLQVGVIAFVAGLIPVKAAEEKKTEAPAITAISPLSLAPGTTTLLRVRGIKLDETTELRFAGEAQRISTELKEKRKTSVPAGFEEKEVGGTEAEFNITLPADFPNGVVSFSIVTSGGETSARELRVFTSAASVDDKDPNGGFREAQLVELGQVIRGSIKEEKDVDVFRFRGIAGQRIQADVVAARGGSLLDSILTLFDSRGILLGTNDDVGKSSDSTLTMTLPADGDYLLALQDVHDRGSSWHQYELTIKEAP
jgi:hypothetical protein